jgi:hypothetical protein
MGTTMINGRGVQTFQHAQQTGAELERSARYAGRTLRRAAETVRAAVWDGACEMLGVGDFAATMVRDAGGATRRLPRRLVSMARKTPNRLNDGLEELTLRGQQLLSRIRRDRDVRSAARQTTAARRETREAADSLRSAAKAQLRAARKAGSRLGRSQRRRYESMTVGELQDLAAQRSISGRSNMNKRELIRALRH